MTFQQALEIMVNTPNADNAYDAIQTIEAAVLAVSEYGDPDSSLQDWIAAGQYKMSDTPESIAAEWDTFRD